jgi:hypothetical protein
MDDNDAGGNPISELRALGESVGKRMLSGAGRVSARVQEERPLGADVLESDDAYLVVFDAPGVEMDDVQVRFEEGTVHVRLDRFRSVYEGYEMVFPVRGLSLAGNAFAASPTSVNIPVTTKAGSAPMEAPNAPPEKPAISRTSTSLAVAPQISAIDPTSRACPSVSCPCVRSRCGCRLLFPPFLPGPRTPSRTQPPAVCVA